MKWYIKCLKQYVDFEGRARRKEYWWFILINFIITMILFICWLAPTFKMGFEAAASGNTDLDQQGAILTMLKNPFMYIYILYYMAMLIPGIAVLVRRLHDIGKSGFWAFFILGGSLLGNLPDDQSRSLPWFGTCQFGHLYHISGVDVHRLAIRPQQVWP